MESALGISLNCLCKWCGIAAYHAVVCTTLSAEEKRLVVEHPVVDDSVGEHGLRCDSENEDAEGEVVLGLGVGPHIW